MTSLTFRKKAPELWSASVSPEVLASVPKKEIGRQEVIFEIIMTEKEFVKDLESTMKVFHHPDDILILLSTMSNHLK